ncbi:hypothetical protein [Mycolicibacterium phlei]|jgi:hypothetical protein
MRRLATTLAMGAVLLGPIVTSAPATAASTAPDITNVQAPVEPTVRGLDCEGTTGRMGCGPGWFWRDGWRGWGCYPC